MFSILVCEFFYSRKGNRSTYFSSQIPSCRKGCRESIPSRLHGNQHCTCTWRSQSSWGTWPGDGTCSLRMFARHCFEHGMTDRHIANTHSSLRSKSEYDWVRQMWSRDTVDLNLLFQHMYTTSDFKEISCLEYLLWYFAALFLIILPISL